MVVAKAPQSLLALALLSLSVCALAQNPAQTPVQNPTQVPTPPPLPDAPSAKTLTPRPQSPPQTPEQAAEALRISKLAIVNGRPYERPSRKTLFYAYLQDSYGLPALGGTTVRALYSQARGTPTRWGTDFPGFMQRFGANYGTIAVTGNVRYAMENIFHEDLRYIPCHGCHVKAKIENALLAEITARHADDGHRFFTLTPTIADFSGPIIAHTLWYPGGPNPSAGAVSARLAFATRIGSHLFREFVLERRHTDPPREN